MILSSSASRAGVGVGGLYGMAGRLGGIYWL
jgi:hypothetical protein